MMEFTGLKDQFALLEEEILTSIKRTLAHGAFIMGPEVSQLEAALNEYCGSRNCITVANGTDALQLVLMAYGVGRGDAVFVPSFTYTATAEVILLLGAEPVFVEVEEETFNIDVRHLRQQIGATRAAGRLRPAAIIGVDLFGRPANWTELNAIAEEFDLRLIADAAQSFGGAVGERHVGTLAPVTTTSFFPAKPLGCYGDGGAIFTDDDELASVLRSLRVHGQGTAKYETVRVGANSRLDTIQAAILMPKLRLLRDEISKRDRLAERYSERLLGLVVIPRREQGMLSAWAQYTIRLQARDQLQQALKKAGIPTAIYYPLPMHLQPAYAQWGEGKGSLPVSERLSTEVLSLPMNPYWREEDADAVCTQIANFFSGTHTNANN